MLHTWDMSKWQSIKMCWALNGKRALSDSRAEILVNHMCHPGLPSAEAVAREAASARLGTVLFWRKSISLEKPPLDLTTHCFSCPTTTKDRRTTELTSKEKQINWLSSEAPHIATDPVLDRDNSVINSIVDDPPKQPWHTYFYWHFSSSYGPDKSLHWNVCCKLSWPWTLSLHILPAYTELSSVHIYKFYSGFLTHLIWSLTQS